MNFVPTIRNDVFEEQGRFFMTHLHLILIYICQPNTFFDLRSTIQVRIYRDNEKEIFRNQGFERTAFCFIRIDYFIGEFVEKNML